MRRLFAFLAVVMAVMAVVAVTKAAYCQEMKCSGVVTDSDSNALSGVRVFAYELLTDNGVVSLAVLKESVTGPDGAFALSVPGQSPGRNSMCVVAAKDGYALAWSEWVYPDRKFELELLEPAAVSGVVVAENGDPIMGAEVRALVAAGGMPRPHWIVGYPPLELLTAATDEAGRFTFDNIPPDVSIDFAVTAPGRERVLTGEPDTPSHLRGAFEPGDEDIRVELCEESRIEGKLVDRETGEGVASATITCSPKRAHRSYENRAVVTDADGKFVLEALAGETYMLDMAGTDDPSKPAVAPTVVETETGETVSGIVLELGPRVEFSITVLDAHSGEPIPGAGVELGDPKMMAGQTDESGVVTFLVPPSVYVLEKAYKYGYSELYLEEEHAIRADAPNEVTLELERLPAISGQVCDADGNPVEAASIWIYPVASPEATETDEFGDFSVDWDPNAWGGGLPEILIVVRQAEKRLAGWTAAEYPYEGIEITVPPSADLLLELRSVAGDAIAGAPVDAMGEFGPLALVIDSETRFTDEDGRCLWEVLPAGMDYTIRARAPGYGQAKTTISLAAGGPETPTLVTLRMKLANLSISGVALDADDKPVEGANVYARGAEQISGGGLSNEEGAFTITGLVEGDVSVEAYERNLDLLGSVKAAAGDQDVEVVLRKRETGPGAAASMVTASLVGGPLPDLSEYGIAELGDATGKIVVLCIADINQRPSRHALGRLSERADEFAGKNIIVVAVDASGGAAEELASYVKDAGLAFEVGRIAEDIEETLTELGASGLPWLIITDRTGDVKEEGVVLSDLDDYL